MLSLVLVGAFLLLAPGCDTVRIRYLMNEGNKLYKGEKYEQAIAEYEKILRIDPSNWGATYQIAVSYLAMYHPGSTHAKDVKYAQKATETLEKLLKLSPPDTPTMEKVRGFYVGLLQAANQTEKAIQFYEGLVQQDSKNTIYWAQLAQLYAKSGDFQNALKCFRKRTEIEPANKEVWYTLGVVLWERSYKGGITVSNEERAEFVAEGMKALQKALSLDPEYFDALSYTNLLYREQAKVFQAQGDLESAQQSIKSAETYMRKAIEVRKKQIAAQKAKAA
jgi:tetratricopeptide (TPR) repeat protein